MDERLRRLQELFGKELEGSITLPERGEMEVSLEDSGLAMDFAKHQRPERSAGELVLAAGGVSWRLRSQFRKLYQPWRTWLKVAAVLLIGFVAYTVWSLRVHESHPLPVQELGTISSSGLKAPRSVKATPVAHEHAEAKPAATEGSLWVRSKAAVKGAYYTSLAKVYGWVGKAERSAEAQVKADEANGVAPKVEPKEKGKSKKAKAH